MAAFECSRTAIPVGAPSSWLDLSHPDSIREERSWRYWDSRVDSPTTAWIRIGIDGHPYNARQQLIWLIKAASSYHIDLS